MSHPNLIGTWTLYCKEVRRFLKVYNQTLVAPAITALLFLAIFSLALGERVHYIGHVPFSAFMAAGLIMMAVVQNAFANTSSSLIMGKVLGTLVDYLMPPLSPGEIVFAMVMGGVTRGILVGVLVMASIAIFVPIPIQHISYVLFYIFFSSVLLALLGILGGILAETFDQMAAVTSYVITPLAFLSGTFYSVKNLPPFWYHVSQYNPFFYMIDGFRYGLTGYHDGNLPLGIAFILTTTAVLWAVTYRLWQRGYRIKQ